MKSEDIMVMVCVSTFIMAMAFCICFGMWTFRPDAYLQTEAIKRLDSLSIESLETVAPTAPEVVR